MPDPQMPIFSLRPDSLRERRRSLIDVELDPAQKSAVQRPGGSAMLVLGEAGHGKTTVALHRLAHLYQNCATRFRAVVIVPHAGLERLLQPLVTRLGADVSVQAYDRWATSQARRAFGDIPRRESTAASSAVLRIKRHPLVRTLLQELAAGPPGRIDDDHDAPPADTRAHAHRADLQQLFGDGDRMRWLAERAGFSERMLAEILEHTHIQFLQRSEDAYAHVDAERLVSLDAKSLDAGGPDENAASIDSEDYAVLFELDRLRALHDGVRPTRPRPFDCIVLDEAQEFAPLELALIGRSLVRAGTLVVAGDADQQTDAAAGFESWQATMRALRAPAYDTVSLDIGYRCPPRIVEFARSLRHAVPPPATVPALCFADEPALAAWLAAEAANIEEGDPGASFCIITRTHALARRLAAALRGKVPCKLVLAGEFVFHRGVDVTTLDNVKGLEFDYVVVADATLADYPPTPEARRALYVAATRARHQLALACVGEPSPLSPPALPVGSRG
jgi:DNA helicase IV